MINDTLYKRVFGTALTAKETNEFYARNNKKTAEAFKNRKPSN